MNKYVEIAGTAIGAVIGLAVHGPAGVLPGAACGLALSLMPRREEGGWLLKSSELAEMRKTMHIARAAIWAVHPLTVENGGSDRGRIVEYVFDLIVAPHAKALKMNPQALYEHLLTVSESGVAPMKSLRYVKRKLAPNMLRKNTDLIDEVVTIVLNIEQEYGNYDVTRAWFIRWAEEVGIGQHADTLWTQAFGEGQVRDMNEERAEMIERSIEAAHREAMNQAE